MGAEDGGPPGAEEYGGVYCMPWLAHVTNILAKKKSKPFLPVLLGALVEFTN